MGLSQALATAMSGLRATQASISLVGSNVANAETPGYVRKTVIQVAGTNGDYGSSVLLNGVDRQLDQYLQTQMRTETSGAAYADIRATFLANLQNVYGNPAETGTIEDSFNKLLTAFQGLSTSPDSQSARIGAVAAAQTHGADAQRDDPRHSEPSRQRRDGHQRFHRHGEQRDGPDRVHQQPAPEQRQDRRGDGVAAGPARSVHHPAVGTGGHQDRRQRPQPGDGVHELRRATRRHRGGAAELQSAGHGNAQHAVQSDRSDQEQRRHHHHQFPAWRQLRSGVHQLDPLRQDRRLSRTARQHAGEGAGADRPVRGVDVERAVGQDDGRHCRARVGPAAGRLRPRPRRDCSPATSFTSPTRTTPPASRTISRSCASTIRACCR